MDELEAAAADAGVDPNGFALRDWFEMLAQADVRLERGAVPRLVDYCDAMDEDD